MNKLFSILFSLFLAGCVSEPIYTSTVPSAYYANGAKYGCTIVTDEYGSREVCETYYYPVSNGVVYWDPYFRIWVGPGGYWHGGVWNHGYYPGFRTYYGHGFYHPNGFSHGGGYRGGFHGGGFHGGHGGHR